MSESSDEEEKNMLELVLMPEEERIEYENEMKQKAYERKKQRSKAKKKELREASCCSIIFK